MQTTAGSSRGAAAVTTALAFAAATTSAQTVPPPPIDGVVVEDITQSYVFDRIGFDSETGPFVVEDAYRGTVRSMVIRAPDNTFDFYFHIAPSSGSLSSFVVLWKAPASYTVAYHVTDRELPWAPAGPSGPAPGTSQVDALSAGANWREDETSGGALSEGWLGLDTDAKAYAFDAQWQVGDSLSRLIGNYSGRSETFTTFGPAIPEPETYALMLSGIALLALKRRRRCAAMGRLP